MSEMIERLEPIVRDWVTENQDRFDAGGSGEIDELLRLLLSAMREPTSEMCNAAEAEADEYSFGPGEARHCWREMIDTALVKPPTA